MSGRARWRARLRLLLRCLAMLAALCAGCALAQPYAFITHIALGATPGSLTVVDLRTQSVVGHIDFGGTLEAVAAERSGRYVWIADRLGFVYKIDVAARTVVAGPIDVGSNNLPRGIAVDPAGAFVYVANMSSDTVAVIDTSSNTVLSPQIAVGVSPHGIAVDPTGRWVYVTNEADNTVSVISTATKSVVATVPVGVDPVGVAFNPAGTRAYVANNVDNTITVIDPSGPHTVLGSPIAVSGGPFGLAISSDGKRLYSSDCCADAVTEIDIQGDANTITDTVPVDLSPEGIAIEPLGRYVLAVNVEADSLSIIDTSVSPKTVTSLPMGSLLNSTFGVFITPGPPAAPTAVSATAGNAQATVTFTPPALDGGQPITGYVVTSSPAGGVDASAGTTSTSHGVTGLTNGTSYTFTVTATNSMGTGDPSAASNAVTPATVPGAPSAVVASAGNASATVAFTPPASDGGTPITGYAVISSPAGGVDADAGSTVTPHDITGLINGTSYTFTVRATNAVGAGPASSASNSVTPIAPPGVPGAPTAVVATAGNASATVAFTPPASDGGSPITGYTVTSNPPGGVDASAGTTATTHAISGLTNGTSYTFTVTATNAVGTGPPSIASNSVRPIAPPGAPTAVVATAGNASATVTFTPPASDGGSSITGYAVASNPAGGVDGNAGTTGTSHGVTGLTNGTAYTFTVRATNAAGTGPASAASNSVTPIAPPGAPTAVLATAGNASATVTFTPPASNGGSPITGYAVSSIPAGGVDGNAGTISTSHVITGLTNGTAYTFTVRATNAIGTGPASAASNSVTPTAPPGVPGEPTAVIASAGNASATVTFVRPASDGGSPITGYAVTSSPAGGVDAEAGTTATTHAITGLTNGTSYTFTVKATNAIGAGPTSAASNSVTPTLRAFSGPSATGTGTINASFTGGGAACTFVAPRFIGSPPGALPVPPTRPSQDVVFPQGMFDFTASGCTTGSTLTFTLVYPSSIAGATYWKYGPTATDPSPHWYVLPATISGNTVTFTITDGGLGDDDLAANGTIVDQGGPALGLEPVPTLSEWMLVVLGLAMLGYVAHHRRRR